MTECFQIIAVTMAHIIVGGIDQGAGAEYTRQECNADQSVYVRTTSEIKTDTAHIDAMKADALGVPFSQLKKCYVIENGQLRWHMWEKCK